MHSLLRNLGLASALAVVVAITFAHADEPLPASDAQLLMARYATGGMSILAQPGGVLKAVPGIAIYSDGTVLIADAQMMRLPLNLRMINVPADIVQARFRKFYDGLANAAPTYGFNCWSVDEDGRSVPANCIYDAGTANLILQRPDGVSYKGISVYAGDLWREFPQMRDFVPAGYLDLMAWMDGLQDLPSKPWQTSKDAVPGFSGSDPACEVAKELCR